MRDDKIIIKKYYHIGVATATEEGLVVPVIRGADRLDIPGIAREIHDLAKSAREKKLPLEALQGGTFTITNPGTYGAVFSTPIIHPRQPFSASRRYGECRLSLTMPLPSIR